MTTSRCIKIAVLVPLLALCTSTYADAHRAIVAGSFNDRNNAVAFQDQVAQKLGGVAPAAQVDIAATTVRNKPYFRVIIHEPGKQSDSAVHTLLDAVRKSGFPSSWVTRLNTTTTASINPYVLAMPFTTDTGSKSLCFCSFLLQAAT